MSLPDINRYVALDCEMVGVRDPDRFGGQMSRAACVAIVNHYGGVLFHSYIHAPRHEVLDWRSYITGIYPGDLDNAPSLTEVQGQVFNILRGKIIVGHSVNQDLDALGFTAPASILRDVATYRPFLFDGQLRSLRDLARNILGRSIQVGVHDPVEDAQASMDIFLAVRRAYEKSVSNGNLSAFYSQGFELSDC
ncbi:hypothetical protein M231_06732 [Tremella mesenterica]|uniref:Exonuclease domain-containing protein n=1 Tax=Tremella mesenterica TaxID=5217 RepID=A0A4Q1BB45_TREME|nr:hypothetical protein M231_06732 [Tremella mesenterica]